MPPGVVVPLTSLCPSRCCAPRVVLVPWLGCTRGDSALHVIGPFVSFMGLTRRVEAHVSCSALRVVGGPHVSCSALRIVGGPYMSSSGPSRGRWALCDVVGPFALLVALHVVLGPFALLGALQVVLGPYALSLGLTRRHWAVTCHPWALGRRLAFRGVGCPAGSSTGVPYG